MLRLSIAKNLNFLSKTLSTNVDPAIFVNRLSASLAQTSNVNNYRLLSLSAIREANKETPEEEDDKKVHILYKRYAGTARDRTKVIPVDTSIAYIKSTSFQTTYSGKRVWELYRRVHKGQLPPIRTRLDCVRHNVIATGSPCPICRDEYLVLDYRNLELLKMFISPHTGEVSAIKYAFFES